MQAQKLNAAEEAGIGLARLMERHLGYNEGRIDNIALRLFIRAYGDRVESYVRAIRDEQD